MTYIFWRITSAYNRMQVCGIWESVNGKKNSKHVFIAQVKGAVFSHLFTLQFKWSKIYKMCQRVFYPLTSISIDYS